MDWISFVLYRVINTQHRTKQKQSFHRRIKSQPKKKNDIHAAFMALIAGACAAAFLTAFIAFMLDAALEDFIAFMADGMVVNCKGGGLCNA